MGFFAECSKTHGACYKVLHDFLYGLHFVDADGGVLEVKEVADEDGGVFLVHQPRKSLELLVIAGTGG